MAEVQKQTLSGETTQRFIEFVMMQAHQAALFLGQAPHPQTGEPEINLDVARMFIDQLAMIQEKTRGNLTSEETKVLSNALSNLQMAYVEVSQESGRTRPEPARRGESAPESPTQAESHSAGPLNSAEQPPAGAPEPSAPMTSTEPETESRKKFTKSYGP